MDSLHCGTFIGHGDFSSLIIIRTNSGGVVLMSDPFLLAKGTALLGMMVLLALLMEGLEQWLKAHMEKRESPSALQSFYEFLVIFWKWGGRGQPQGWLSNIAPVVSVSTLLSTFLYIPIGPLPALLGTRGGWITVLGLLALGESAAALTGFAYGSNRSKRSATREMRLFMSYGLVLGWVLSCLSWLAIKKGLSMPFSLQTFIESPLWGEISSLVSFEGVGLFSLFLALLSMFPQEAFSEATGYHAKRTLRQVLLSLALNLRGLCLSAIMICLFFPFSISDFFHLQGSLAVGMDFLCFWFKILILQSIILPGWKNLFLPSLSLRFPFFKPSLLGILFSLMGASILL